MLNMGKPCIIFKNFDDLPYGTIANIIAKNLKKLFLIMKKVDKKSTGIIQTPMLFIFYKPNSFLHSTNALIAKSKFSLVWAADICVLILAFPFGTTG